MLFSVAIPSKKRRGAISTCCQTPHPESHKALIGQAILRRSMNFRLPPRTGPCGHPANVANEPIPAGCRWRLSERDLPAGPNQDHIGGLSEFFLPWRIRHHLRQPPSGSAIQAFGERLLFGNVGLASLGMARSVDGAEPPFPAPAAKVGNPPI